MYFKDEKQNENVINILPMIDIIFAILSFFIVSSLYLTKVDSIKVNLPKSSTAKPEQNKPLIVTINAERKIYFNSKLISLNNLAFLVRTNIKELEKPLVLIRADASVNHGLIINILDELRKIEDLKIGISTTKNK